MRCGDAMNRTPKASPQHQPLRLRTMWAASCALTILVAGCESIGDPAYAPAVGTLGGMAVGAAISSATGGDAGYGAAIGGMLGRAGGELSFLPGSPTRVAADARLLHNLPATLRDAAQFDASIGREYPSLARRCATAPGPDALVASSIASRKLQETDAWLQFLAECDATIARAIRAETRHPSGLLGKRLQQRDQVRLRLTSLKTRRSWLQALAS